MATTATAARPVKLLPMRTAPLPGGGVLLLEAPLRSVWPSASAAGVGTLPVGTLLTVVPGAPMASLTVEVAPARSEEAEPVAPPVGTGTAPLEEAEPGAGAGAPGGGAALALAVNCSKVFSAVGLTAKTIPF